MGVTRAAAPERNLDDRFVPTPVHFDYKPPRTEDDDGVWASAAACIRNYLILQEKVRAFRADPDVRAALAAAGGRTGPADPGSRRDLAGYRRITADAEALSANLP